MIAGARLASSSGACAMLWWAVMLLFVLPASVVLVGQNTPALRTQVEALDPRAAQALEETRRWQMAGLRALVDALQ